MRIREEEAHPCEPAELQAKRREKKTRNPRAAGVFYSFRFGLGAHTHGRLLSICQKRVKATNKAHQGPVNESPFNHYV